MKIQEGNHKHHFITFTQKIVKQFDSYFEGVLIVTERLDSVI